MPTLMELRSRPHWSFSSLYGLLSICSLQWRFQKIDKLKPKHTSVNLVAGSCYHRTLEQVYLALQNGKTFSTDDALEFYTEDWRRSSANENIKYGKLDADSIEAQGRGLIGVAMENIDPSEDVLSVSEAFCVPIIHQGEFLTKPLLGEYDLTVRDKDGHPVVVDFKTSATRYSQKKVETSLQMSAYHYAYTVSKGVEPSLRFDVAVKNKTPVFETHVTERDKDDWALLGALVAKAETLVENSIFFPNRDSFACNDCGFKAQCAAWCHECPSAEKMAA